MFVITILGDLLVRICCQDFESCDSFSEWLDTEGYQYHTTVDDDVSGPVCTQQEERAATYLMRRYAMDMDLLAREEEEIIHEL